jgi:adenine-specific DNA-methyltransferase
VKAFRDTWRDGIHSYLAYLRDRLVVARELLTESGSCFVQIGDENVHRVRAVMDEVFGERNFVSQIVLKTTSGAGSPSGGTLTLAGVYDSILWFARNNEQVKYRQLYFGKADMQTASLYRRVIELSGADRLATEGEMEGTIKLPDGAGLFRPDNLTSQSSPESATFKVAQRGLFAGPGKGGWKTNPKGMSRLLWSQRVYTTRNGSYQYLRRLDDFNVTPINNVWTDVGTGSFTADKIYIVQTNQKIVQRCLLMTTDPGDLVLDPTCGSGTTATVAEQWGRRWITIDTSRVALALARARIMGARYPYYLLADSPEGQQKEAEASRRPPSTVATHGDLRQGFVYERVPHVTLKSIANNSEIDTIWERLQPSVEMIRQNLNEVLAGHHLKPFRVSTGARAGRDIVFTLRERETLPSGEEVCRGELLEWELPREAPADWPELAQGLLDKFWHARIHRQLEIDASIAARADFETLYDRPYEDRKKVRVAGPFTVESLSPHRAPIVDEMGELIHEADAAADLRDHGASEAETYQEAMLDNLRRAGVHQAGKADRITFTALQPWPGEWIAAEGRYLEGETERRAAILIGSEYGTLARADLVAAAREAADAGMDVLIACAFNFDAMASEFDRLGRVPVLRARMNPDLHMAGELKSGGGNLFTVFGDPDIGIVREGEMVRVELRGLDIFKPATGDVVTSEPDEIACWFIDTDYNEEAFFVRHAYFPGTELPYKSLRASLKAEVDEEAWESLKRTVSRPFPRPRGGRIAVKVINHLGDEVMKVMGV